MKSVLSDIKIFTKLYDWRALAATIVILVSLAYLPWGFIPDYFQLNRSIASGVFVRITVSFISVFSFLITVLILGYGFLREKFRRLTLKEFLENRRIKLLVTFFISVFLTNIFSAIYLDAQAVSNNSLNVAYFSLFASTLYFICFIPFALLVVASTDSLELIGKYIDKFELKHFRSHELMVKGNETNPIVVVSNLVRAFAEKDDFHSINAITFSTQKKIEDLIGNSKDVTVIGQLLTGQRIIWDTIVHKAFQKKEFSVITNIFWAASFYHLHFSKQKTPLLYLEEIEFFTHSLIERLVDENIHDVASEVFRIYEKIIKNHYDNSVPKEVDIHELIYFFDKTEENYKKAYSNPGQDQNRIDNNLQWRQVYSDIEYIFSVAIHKAIDNKNRVIFKDALHAIAYVGHAAYNSTMGDYQKAWITRLQSDSYYHYLIEGFKAGLIDNNFYLQSYNPTVLYRMIDSNSLSKKYVFTSTSDFMIGLHKLGKLDLKSFNFIGAIGRHCANNYDLPGAKESLNYILKMVQFLKREFETDLIRNVDNYNYLKEEVESFKKWHDMTPHRTAKIGEWEKKNENLNPDLIDQLSKLLAGFKDLEQNTIETRIDWDD